MALLPFQIIRCVSCPLGCPARPIARAFALAREPEPVSSITHYRLRFTTSWSIWSTVVMTLELA